MPALQHLPDVRKNKLLTQKHKKVLQKSFANFPLVWFMLIFSLCKIAKQPL